MHCKTLSTILWAVLAFLPLALSGNSSAVDFKVLHSFQNGVDGTNPRFGVTLDSAGNLYGTALGGTWYWGGVAFKLTPNPDGTWTENTLTSFDGGLDSWDPYSGLTFDGAGNLYGEEGSGGPLPGGCGFYSSNGCGTVYKLAPNPDGSWTRSFVHTFEGRSDGRAPGHGLILDAAGNFYGTTESDGLCDGARNRENKCGTVFQLTPNPDGSWTHTVIYSFPAKANAFPLGALTLDAAGNLYGTTQWGGGLGTCDGYNCGTVYKLSRNPDGTWNPTILRRFGNGSEGGRPMGGVIFDPAGNLYGTTSTGGNTDKGCDCGTVFKLIPNPDGTWTEKVLHRFATGGLMGSNPVNGLAMDAAGNLYGTTLNGAHGFGAVFKLTTNPDGTWTKSTLHAFSGHGDGGHASWLILDSVGNLYGTAFDGGAGYGVVFEITP